MKKWTMMIVAAVCAISASNVPLSKQASLVEVYSSSEVTVKATGLGRNEKAAVGDLQKAAVWFVLYNGTDPLLKTVEAKARFDEQKDLFFDIMNISNYVTWESDKAISSMKTKLPTGKRGFKMVKTVRINRSALQTALEGMGILTSKDDLAEQIGLPFLMVIPETKKGETPLDVFESNNLATHSAGIIESFLTARKYDVVVPRAQEQLNDLASVQSELKGAAPDVSYQLALSLGADIYITFSGTVENSKAMVVVKAYETTTARLLGTETGYSAARPGVPAQALLEEAINGAIQNVLSRITSYWEDDVARGSQYKIIFKIMDEFTSDEIEEIQFAVSDAMDEMFSTYKENVIADRSMDYLAWATKDEYKRASAIYRDLKESLSSIANVKRITLNRKFLVFGIYQF